MTASAIDIGQAFLDLAKSANGKSEPLTPLKLIKLVYIAHGWMLARNNKPLINEEVKVWKYGPVIPELYKEVKEHGGEPITESISANFDISVLDKEAQYVIKETFKIYGKHSAWALSSMTHKAGSPWDVCVDAGIKTIPVELIQNYYLKLGSNQATAA